MLNGNGSSSSSTQQLATPAAGKLQGPLPGGAGGGDKPPRHPWPMKSMHELDGAARGSKRLAVVPTAARGNEWEPFQCSFCECFFISDEDLRCHIRRCHVPRSWRRGRGKEASPQPPPSVAEQYVSEKRPSLGGGQPSSSSSTSENGSPEVSKQEQQTEQAAAAEAPATPVVKFPYDLNDPAPELVVENGSSA